MSRRLDLLAEPNRIVLTEPGTGVTRLFQRGRARAVSIAWRGGVRIANWTDGD
jgi:hypothetical protein